MRTSVDPLPPSVARDWIVLGTIARFVRPYLFRIFALFIWNLAVFYFRYKHCGSHADSVGYPNERYPTAMCVEWQRFLRLDVLLGVGSVMINFLLFQGWFRSSDAGKEWNEIQMACWDLGFSLLKRTRKPEDASLKDRLEFEEGITRALALVSLFPVVLLYGIHDRAAATLDLDMMIHATVQKLKSVPRYGPIGRLGPLEALSLSVSAKYETAPREHRRTIIEPTFDALRLIYTLMTYVEQLVDTGNMEEKRVLMARDSIRILHKRLVYCDYYQNSEQTPTVEIIAVHLCMGSMLFFTPWRMQSSFGWWGLFWSLPFPIFLSHSFIFLRRLWFPFWTDQVPIYLCLRIARDLDHLWREYEDPKQAPTPTLSSYTGLESCRDCSECAADKCSYCDGRWPSPRC